jgi:hypothetical protein
VVKFVLAPASASVVIAVDGVKTQAAFAKPPKLLAMSAQAALGTEVKT